MMSDGQSTMGIPQAQPDRIEWIYKRAAMLDTIRGEDWVQERLEWLWEHPDAFARGESPECPDGIDKSDYQLFQLGVLFGVEYEHEYPRSEYNGE